MHPMIYTTPFDVLNRWTNLFEGLEEGRQSQNWVPAVDLEDHADHYLVTADLPGIKPEDVEINLDDDVLSIQGERRMETDEGDDEKRYRRIERVYGSFKRSFHLPADADPEAIEARGENGVLHIRLGKMAATQPRRITVQATGGS